MSNGRSKQKKKERDAAAARAAKKRQEDASAEKNSKMTIGVTSFGQTNSSDSSAMRYPFHQSIAADSDYVTFEFYEYEPPFANEGGGTKKTNYNESVSDDILGTPKEKIILYMPEDIQSEYGANWGGAGFGLISKGLMSGAAGVFDGNFNIGNAFKEGMAAAGGATQRKTVDLVVGLANKALGTSITTNQALGGMEGKVVNPNVEMMYESPEMRGFSLNFKMFSSNDDESDEIRKICNTFKRNMLPSFGGQFIKVPNIVKVTFMTGNSANQYVSQFKPCAVTNISINYTPDGSWAAYREGRPVATQLTLQFKELKMLFAEDITIEGASY